MEVRDQVLENAMVLLLQMIERLPLRYIEEALEGIDVLDEDFDAAFAKMAEAVGYEYDPAGRWA